MLGPAPSEFLPPPPSQPFAKWFLSRFPANGVAALFPPNYQAEFGRFAFVIIENLDTPPAVDLFWFFQRISTSRAGPTFSRGSPRPPRWSRKRLALEKSSSRPLGRGLVRNPPTRALFTAASVLLPSSADSFFSKLPMLFPDYKERFPPQRLDPPPPPGRTSRKLWATS